MIWNSILAADIKPETSEAVSAKTLKQCIIVGLLQWFDIYFDFDNFYEKKKCCDVTEELPLNYMDLMCLTMIIILRICLFIFSFYLVLVFVLFSFLQSCTWHSCTLSYIRKRFNFISDMEVISLFGFHVPFAIHVIFFHICVHLAKSHISSLMEKLTNGALVTPAHARQSFSLFSEITAIFYGWSP